MLLLAALAKGKTQVCDLLDADDTRVMLDALMKLDIGIDTRDFSRLVVAGAGGIPKKKMDLFLGNAGTAFRPLTAVLALSGGEYRLSGVPRMHERPIRDLVDAAARHRREHRLRRQGGLPAAGDPSRATSPSRAT